MLVSELLCPRKTESETWPGQPSCAFPGLRAIALGGLGLVAVLAIAGCDERAVPAPNGETKAVSEAKNGGLQPVAKSADVAAPPPPMAAASADMASSQPASAASAQPASSQPAAAAADDSGLINSIADISASLAAPEPAMPMFPWPPPRASASQVVPLQFFTDAGNADLKLGAVEQQIRDALDATGYFERSYFATPQGFAIVTRIERINDDGSLKSVDERWSDTPGLGGNFDLSSYLRGLFTARVGRFRTIVFVITAAPFHQADAGVSRDEVENWLAEGFNVLPASIAALPFTADYACTALIYEFESRENRQVANLIAPSRLLGRLHLERAGVWAALQ